MNHVNAYHRFWCYLDRYCSDSRSEGLKHKKKSIGPPPSPVLESNSNNSNSKQSSASSSGGLSSSPLSTETYAEEREESKSANIIGLRLCIYYI